MLVANLAYAPSDGRWTALDGRPLHAWAKTAGYVYEAKLRAELTRRLRVTWGTSQRSIADIAGIPKRVLRHFSRRRQQIEAHMAEAGTTGAKAAQVATYATRKAKHTTTPLAAMVEDWRARATASGSTTTTGRRVIGASLAARAARQLEEGSGIPSTTLHRLLADLDRPDGGRLGPDHVVVVDEAAMVGTRKLLELVAHADRANAKVVLIGDPCQLRAIEAGGAFARLARRADRTALTANRRQREASERQALGDLRSGRADEALAAYLAHDRVRHDQDPDALRARIVDDWWTATNDGAEAAMLALHRHQVEDLNARARHKRRAAGRLGVDEVVLGESRHAVGDTVLAHRNDPRIGIVNGDRGRITAIHETAHRVDVALDAGTTVSVPFASAETDHLTHGYAMTIHKTQGATIDVALVLVHPSMAISMGPMVATVFGPTVDALAQMAPQVFVSAHLVGWNAKPAIAARLPDPFVRNSVDTR